MPADSERILEHPERSPLGALVSDFILIQLPMAASAAALLFATARLLGRPLDGAWYAAAFLEPGASISAIPPPPAMPKTGSANPVEPPFFDRAACCEPDFRF